MDRRTLIGFVMISFILVFWMTWNSGNKDKEAATQKRIDDSIAHLDSIDHSEKVALNKKKDDSIKNFLAKNPNINSDSLRKALEKQNFGIFCNAHKGTDSVFTIENERLKADIASKGGKIVRVELKGIKTWDGKPLYLFNNDSTHFGLSFFDRKRKRYSTDSLYFHAAGNSFRVNGKDSNSISMRLYPDTTGCYIEFRYSLRGNSSLVGCTTSFAGLDQLLDDGQSQLDLTWAMNTPSQEKSLKNQQMVASVFYNFDGEDGVDNLKETGEDSKSLIGNVKWVSFKQQYFSSILIAKTKFANNGEASIHTPSDPFTVKSMSATVPVPFRKTAKESFAMNFYFGPNKYSDLKSYDLHLEREINLGWSIFGGINRYIFIPLFSWLGDNIANYGIVILLLTIIVKIVLFPIAYKSFLSSAKMRVLKPEIDEINAKFGKDDPLKKQQATMALYKKAGVNPAAGCIPLLLQIPILFALIRLFPSAYELRQHGFLWAHDLSTYDSVWNFGFNVPGYGDHMSLFALLMTVSTILYTWMNQQTLQPGSAQLPGMKWLIYIMPILFLGFLNSYSSALSYYYFISNMITFTQMAVMKRFVDHDAIRAKIDENKKKPVKQSGFMQRLEKAQRERQKQLVDAQKNAKGGKKK